MGDRVDHRRQLIVDRVREKVTPAQLQMFQLSVLRGWEPRRTAQALGVTLMQVYMARHRVGKLMKAAAVALKAAETSGENFPAS